MARRVSILVAAIMVLAVVVVWLMMRGPRRIPNVYHQRGIITIVAGNGHRGYSGDGGPATKASLSCPEGIALGKDGSIYIADSDNDRIRRVSPNGIITTIAGNGWRAKSKGHWSGYFSGDGRPATKATLNAPQGVAVGPDGSIYIADTDNNRIRKVDSAGIIRTVAGGRPAPRHWPYTAMHELFERESFPHPTRSVLEHFTDDNGPASQAVLRDPMAVAMSAGGSLFVADLNNHRVCRVDPSGCFTVVTGTPFGALSYGDHGPAAKAGVMSPWDVAFVSDGSLLIADSFRQVIRKVDRKGIITRFAGDGWNKAYRPKGEKIEFPWWGRYNGDDMLATWTSLYQPKGIAVAPDGSLYIADTYNRRVRRVDRLGVMTTVVGDGHIGAPRNGQLSTRARLTLPVRVAVDAKGNLYVSDSYRSQVYKVTWVRPKSR